MNAEQEKKVINALVTFIVRVAEKETASEAEIKALPEVVEALRRFAGINFY